MDEPFWLDVNTTTTITREMIEAAIEKVRNEPPHVCGVTEPHLLCFRDYEAGRGRCVNCGQWVGERMNQESQ